MTKIEHFLTNSEFIRWVKNPDEELNAFWKNWMQANPESLSELRKAKEIVAGIRFNEIHPNPEVKKELLSKILKESGNMKYESILPKKEIIDLQKGFWDKIGLFYKVAAILIFTFGISWMLLPTDSIGENDPAKENIPMIEKLTVAGEKLSFSLPDGTRVWLNSGSVLQFPEQFSDTARIVTLVGEGFFEVEKDASKPFKVISDGMITTALGTSFNINTKKKASVKVSLVTGKVKVGESVSGEEIVLDPGKEFTYHKNEKKGRISDFRTDRILAWKDGKIIFENNSLSEVVQTLEEWYGVNITLINIPKSKWNFSGEFQKQTLDNVLKSISYIEEFEYEIKGKSVNFKF